MINFRYHLVSLTAVFLALAAGITIGAGLVGRPALDRVESQLRQVEERRTETNATNDRLQVDLGRWNSFSEATADRLVEGRLAGVPVFLIGMSGGDRSVVDQLRGTLTRAGATVEATAWLTSRWNLSQAGDVDDLTSLAPVVLPARPDEVRASGLSRLAQEWSAGADEGFTRALADAGFVEFDEPTPGAAAVPSEEAIFVVVSGDGADVAVAQVARPLVERLSSLGSKVLAGQPARPIQDPPPSDPPPEFVFDLRADADLAARISTVDNLDDRRGQLAAVLALAALRDGSTGHFGFGPDARIVPEERA